MTVETEVAALTSAVNLLTSTVNVSKATLDASVAAAEAAYDSFDDRYLGAKVSAPSLDNDGGSLLTGALYFNSTENAMYVYTGASWVITTNYNNVTAPYTLAQTLNTNGNNVTFGDNGKAIFGAGSDLQIYHDGTTNKVVGSINVTGTATMDGLTVEGNALLKASTSTLQFRSSDGASYGYNLKANISNTVDFGFLIEDLAGKDLLKIESNNDISFYEDTGTTAKLTWDASAESLNFADNGKAIFGAGDDLQIYHDGTDSFISDQGTGNLKLLANDFRLANAANNELMLKADQSSAVTAYYAGTAKLATTATGIDVTGTATMDGLTVEGNVSIGTQNTGSGKTLQFLGAGGSEHRINFADGVSTDVFSVHYDGTDASPSNDLYIESFGNKLIKFDQNGDISFYEDTGTTPKFFWDASAESLGIGTSSPSGLLDLTTAFSTSLDIEGGDNNSKNIIFRKTTGGTQQAKITVIGDALQFFTGPTDERMRIDSSGRLLVGTTSVGYGGVDLTVGDTTDSQNGLAIQTSTTGSGYLLFGDGSGAASYRGQINYKHGDDYMAFSTANAERMRIDSSGNLLVGKSAVDTSVAGTVISSGKYIFQTRDSAAPLLLRRNTTDGSIAEFYKDGTAVGSISVTASATTYNTSSDQRLKENIADADDAGSKIDAIQVRQYDWKADGSHQDYGMVAQELQLVAPEAVSGDADSEEMMGVDYSKLVPMLIKEIQSLRNRVAQLEGI